jgi:hypothetical protein
MIFQGFIGVTDETIGITEAEEQPISVFPNPVHEMLTITVPSKLSGSRYGIYDPLGREILSGRASERTQISVSSLQPGVYFFRIESSVDCYKIIRD